VVVVEPVDGSAYRACTELCGFLDVPADYFLFVESGNRAQSYTMTNDLEQHRRTWTAMLAALGTCFSCRSPLRRTAEIADGFCRGCLDRSRASGSDELGGES
jgi:hypothetical protein